MSRNRPAAGGGRVVDVAPDRLVGWVTRFGVGHGGLVELTGDAGGVVVRAADGSDARIEVPFGPLEVGDREPLEAVLDHLAGVGPMGMILVRAGAHSVGICRDRTVLRSSTDTHYVQGRTAAGGWSQQRYARRRGNQLDAALDATVRAAVRVLGDAPPDEVPAALVVGGDAAGITTVLQDSRLRTVAALPRREFRDIAEPRRAVLDDVAGRSLDVSITVRNA